MERSTPIIVVSGPPASGKTTLATSIADELGLPLIAKDSIKERLYDALGPGDREWSRWLGRATYPLIFHFLAEQLRAGRPAVVEATFGPERANDEFAALNRRWPFDALQLYCTAPPEVLLARYAERAPARHPGHLDASIQDEVAAALSGGRWSRLELPGRCVVIDTTAPLADGFRRVVELAREHVEEASRGIVPADDANAADHANVDDDANAAGGSASTRTWPADWEARRRGEGCPACAEGRPEEIPAGRRVFAGTVSDAYLNSTAAARGYVLVFWRGRHVADATELADPEADRFAREVRTVSRAIEMVYRPAKLNILALGNSLPHLHAHIVPRYIDDADPGRPPRFMMSDRAWPAIPADDYLREVRDLRAAVESLGPPRDA